MTNAWDERKKALEEDYFHKKDQEAIDQIRRKACLGHCPKCGELLKEASYHDIPLDQCPACRGIWLGQKELEILAQKTIGPGLSD